MPHIRTDISGSLALNTLSFGCTALMCFFFCFAFHDAAIAILDNTKSAKGSGVCRSGLSVESVIHNEAKRANHLQKMIISRWRSQQIRDEILQHSHNALALTSPFALFRRSRHKTAHSHQMAAHAVKC